MACITDTNVSQGSVAMHARCSGIFNIHLTQNLPTNFQWQKFFNRLRFDRIMVMSLWPRFFLAHPVYILVGWCRRLSGHSITSYKSMPTAFGWYWTTLSVRGRRFQLPTTLCRRSMWDISHSHWLLAMPKAVSRAGCLDVWTVSGENLMHKNVGCNTAIQRLLTPPKFHTKI